MGVGLRGRDDVPNTSDAVIRRRKGRLVTMRIVVYAKDSTSTSRDDVVSHASVPSILGSANAPSRAVPATGVLKLTWECI